MATGPFQVDPNPAREIAPVSQRGGFDTIVPASNLGAAAGDIINTVAPVIAKQQQEAAAEDLRTNLGSIRDALYAARFPNVQSTLFTEEGKNNPVNKQAIKELQSLANASLQGRLPQQFAIERMNVVVSQAVAANPQWRDELNQVARDMLGFSPEQRLLSELLAAPSTQAAKLTPAEKGQNKLAEDAAYHGMTPEQWQRIVNQQVKLEVDKSTMSVRKLQGEYDANAAVQDAYLSTTTLSGDFMSAIAQEGVRGGVPDPIQLKQRIATLYNQERQRLLTNLPRGSDISTLNSAFSQLDQQRTALENLADNSSALTYLTQKRQLAGKIAEDKLSALPVVGEVFDALGATAAATLMDSMGRFSADPEKAKLFMQSGQPGAGVWSIGLQLEAAGESVKRYKSGQAPSTKQEALSDVQTSVTLMTQPKLTGADAVPLIEWVRRAGGDQASVRGMTQDKVVSNLSKVKEAQAPIINLYQSELARLTTKFDELSRRGAIPQDLSFQEGKVTGGVTQSRRDDDGASADFNNWARLMTNLLEYGNKYSLVGVLPSTVFENPNAVLTGLQARATDLQAQAKAAAKDAQRIRRTGYDANGKLVFLNEGDE